MGDDDRRFEETLRQAFQRARDGALISLLLDNEFTLFGKRAEIEVTITWPEGLPSGCRTTQDVLDLLARNVGRERPR